MEMRRVSIKRYPSYISYVHFSTLNLFCSVDSQILSTWTQMEILTLNANNLSTLGEIIPMPNLRVLYVLIQFHIKQHITFIVLLSVSFCGLFL